MKTPTGTYVITTTDFYGEFFEAVLANAAKKDGRDIEPEEKLKTKTGMKLLVRWPDGKFTKETIEVTSGSDSAQVDMNNSRDYFETRRINVVKNVHGQKVLIPLKKGQKVRVSRAA